jgi:hypothetical protein
MGKTKFTCTEHFGHEDATELMLESMIDYINQRAGRKLVRAKSVKLVKHKLYVPKRVQMTYR